MQVTIGAANDLGSIKVSKTYLQVIYIALGILVLAVTFRPIVEGDGVGYYAYLHAVLVTHSLDFTSEYNAAIAAHVPLYRPLVETHTSTGHLADYFPIGSAVLAAPAYIAALALRPSGEPQYGTPFVEAFTLTSLFLGLVALAICYRLAVLLTHSRRAALAGVLGAALATPFTYYALSDPSYSHTFSIFAVSAFLYAWWLGPPQSGKGWFGLGLLGGLMAMTRFQEGLFLAVVLIDVRRLRWSALLLIPGALVGFAPQLAVDQIQFGAWLPERPPEQALDPLHGQYLAALFSSRDGLFVWSPAILVAALGIGFFIQDRRMRWACLLTFVLELAIIGAAPDTPGRAFGPRRFLDLLPFAAVGLAAVAARVGPRLDWVVVGVLSGWNLVLDANFVYVMRSSPPDDYVALLAGQSDALASVPKLFAKGSVVRDLVLWRQAGAHFDPGHGFSLLLLQLVTVVTAVAVAQMPPDLPPAKSSAGVPGSDV